MAGPDYLRTSAYKLEDLTPNHKRISKPQLSVRIPTELQDQVSVPADALAPSYTMVSLTPSDARPTCILWAFHCAWTGHAMLLFLFAPDKQAGACGAAVWKAFCASQVHLIVKQCSLSKAGWLITKLQPTPGSLPIASLELRETQVGVSEHLNPLQCSTNSSILMQRRFEEDKMQ